MDILNSREWAIVAWSTLAIFYFVISPKMNKVRSSIGDLIDSVFARVLIRFYFINLVYVTGVVLLLRHCGLWETHQIKNTLVWFFTVGIYSAFQVEKIKNDKKYFKRLVFDSFKLIAILQFITNIQPLNFAAELVIVPIIFLISLVTAIAERNKKTEIVAKITNFILVCFGVFILIKSFYYIILSFDKLNYNKIIFDFFTPPLLTLLYIPFLFIIMLHYTYTTAFVKVNYNIKNRYLRVFSKIIALVLLNTRSEMVERWSNHLVYSKPQNLKETLESFITIFKMKRAENTPKEIPISEGWSPYLAKDFLVSHGLETGYYHQSIDEWFASSKMVEFGKEIIPHNIAYYVEGSKDIANLLKLKLNVNNSNSSSEALGRLLEVSKELYLRVFEEKMPDKISRSILDGKEIHHKYGPIGIVIEKDIWKSHAFNGYEVKFMILHE